MEVDERLFLGEFVCISVFKEFSIGSSNLDLPGSVHAHEIVLILNGSHSNPPIRSIDLILRLNAIIIQVVGRASSVASEFA
jgi:hypothetical protein